jgi:hypothetical protein
MKYSKYLSIGLFFIGFAVCGMEQQESYRISQSIKDYTAWVKAVWNTFTVLDSLNSGGFSETHALTMAAQLGDIKGVEKFLQTHPEANKPQILQETLRQSVNTNVWILEPNLEDFREINDYFNPKIAKVVKFLLAQGALSQAKNGVRLNILELARRNGWNEAAEVLEKNTLSRK